MPVMESTTLITFMLQHPTARKVELLGSWDNFTESYGMGHDRRRGKGHWSGCHSFRNIICDGDVTDIHEKRAGGLRMGGTYWYFYRIDGDEEFHDPSQQTTTACPLMPGQTLNVLEVPFETERFTSHSRSSSISISSVVQTLNPDDRYLTPRPAPKPRLPKLITSAEAASSAGHLSTASRRDRPWSAFPASSYGWNDRAGASFREIKSASISPTNAANVLKAAFQHLKDPASALTPSQGGRGRSRILYGDHLRSQRTKSPSMRELRSQISRPMSMDSPPKSVFEIERRAEMTSSHQQPLIVQKRSPSPNLFVRRLQENDSKALENFPTSPERGRVVSIELGRAGRAPHKRGFSDSFSSRRSSSMGRRREPSPLRNLAMTQQDTRTVDGLQIPSCVPEVDMEDAMSPRENIDTSEIGANLSLSERRHSAPNTPCVETFRTSYDTPPRSVPEYNKELPPLPTDLIPEPLFFRNESTEMQLTLHALNKQYITERQYSPYRPEFDIPLPESPEACNEEGSESQSPTFSSIRGGTSGACTPHRLSELRDWPPRDNLYNESGDLFIVPPPFDLNHSLEKLSIRTGTESTASTAMPYRLPDVNPFVEDKAQKEPEEQRQLTQMEQLLDEFDYLGAALI